MTAPDAIMDEMPDPPPQPRRIDTLTATVDQLQAEVDSLIMRQDAAVLAVFAVGLVVICASVMIARQLAQVRA